MTDKGIIFSAPMVRALLAGRKTQTRRLCKLNDDPKSPLFFKVPYAPGDRLYVRENFQLLRFGDYLPTKACPADVRFAATDPLADLSPEDRGYPWRPCIHMPRWASRMFLTVTDVRVQRLQEISEADARAEGLTPVLKSMPPLQGCDGALRSREVFEWEKGWSVNAVPAFGALWNSLHTVDGTRWDDNPWIVAVSFDVHHGNIDDASAMEVQGV